MWQIMRVKLLIFSWQVNTSIHSTNFDSVSHGTSTPRLVSHESYPQCSYHCCKCYGIRKLLLHGPWCDSKHLMFWNLSNKCSRNLHFYMFPYILDQHLDHHFYVPLFAQSSRSYWGLWFICCWVHRNMDFCLLESSWNKRHAFRGHHWVLCYWCKAWNILI